MKKKQKLCYLSTNLVRSHRYSSNILRLLLPAVSNQAKKTSALKWQKKKKGGGPITFFNLWHYHQKYFGRAAWTKLTSQLAMCGGFTFVTFISFCYMPCFEISFEMVRGTLCTYGYIACCNKSRATIAPTPVLHKLIACTARNKGLLTSAKCLPSLSVLKGNM